MGLEADLNKLTWHKSSYTADAHCVEVAFTPQAIAMRDSKDPNGPMLVVTPTTFTRFINSLR